jgi:hypothetical protein
MDQIKNWSDVFLTSLQNLWYDIVAIVPTILATIILLFIGWIVARLVKAATIRLVKLVKFEKWFQAGKAREFMEKVNFNRDPALLIGKFMYWLVLLIFLVVISETLGWKVVSEKVAAIIAYVPQLLAGVLIFIVGFYISNIVKRAIAATASSMEIASGKILSEIAFYVLMVIITITTLDQIGIDVDLIKSNLIVIVAGVMAAFAIAYGIGARQTVSNLIASFYSRRSLEVGQKIRLDQVEGTITNIGSVAVTLKTEEGLIVIPSSKLNEGILTILSE